MKLTVDTLDDYWQSAVINIGKNNGYVEAFVSGGVLHLNLFNKQGDVVHSYTLPTKELV